MPILDHSAYLTPEARSLKSDGIRGLLALEERPNMVSFLAGRPNDETFPFKSMTLHIGPDLGDDSGKGMDLELEGEDMKAALQYGPTAGFPPLRKFLSEFTAEVHSIPMEEKEAKWRTTVGAGCQDLLNKCFQVMISPGDSVLVECPVYAGTLSVLELRSCELIEVEVDSNGLSSESLLKILTSWPEEKPYPKLLYSTPVGSNPSGYSADKQRKLEVLEICEKYNIMIVEDDPYYFLASPRVPSYLELDKTNSLVLRFDSFSKVLSSGVRLGWATGPPTILNAMDHLTSAMNLQPSSVGQAILWTLLKKWGSAGFLKHCTDVAVLYQQRREWFEALAHKELDGVASWVSPIAGLFLWIDISPLPDSQNLVLVDALEKGVLAVPGYSFYPLKRTSPHLRVAFSCISRPDAEIGFKRLGEAIREARKRAGIDV